MIKLRDIYPIVISGGDPCSPHHAGTSEAWDIESYRQALIPLDFALLCFVLQIVGNWAYEGPSSSPSRQEAIYHQIHLQHQSIIGSHHVLLACIVNLANTRERHA